MVVIAFQNEAGYVNSIFLGGPVVKVSQHLVHEKRVKFAAGVQDGNQPESDPTTMTKSSGAGLEAATPRSDAILNCPACMTTLCLDCQRYK